MQTCWIKLFYSAIFFWRSYFSRKLLVFSSLVEISYLCSSLGKIARNCTKMVLCTYVYDLLWAKAQKGAKIAREEKPPPFRDMKSSRTGAWQRRNWAGQGWQSKNSVPQSFLVVLCGFQRSSFGDSPVPFHFTPTFELDT